MTELKTLEQIDENYRVAVHELGHNLLCSKWELGSSPIVFGELDKYFDTDGKRIAGECRLDSLGKATDFQLSTIGWAGYLAEHLCGVACPSHRNPFPLQADTLRDFYFAAYVGFEQIFSLGDQRLICSYRHKWRSFRAAYECLYPNVEKIKRLAPVIAANK